MLTLYFQKKKKKMFWKKKCNSQDDLTFIAPVQRAPLLWGSTATNPALIKYLFIHFMASKYVVYHPCTVVLNSLRPVCAQCGRAHQLSRQ